MSSPPRYPPPQGPRGSLAARVMASPWNTRNPGQLPRSRRISRVTFQHTNSGVFGAKRIDDRAADAGSAAHDQRALAVQPRGHRWWLLRAVVARRRSSWSITVVGRLFCHVADVSYVGARLGEAAVGLAGRGDAGLPQQGLALCCGSAVLVDAGQPHVQRVSITRSSGIAGSSAVNVAAIIRSLSMFSASERSSAGTVLGAAPRPRSALIAMS